MQEDDLKLQMTHCDHILKGNMQRNQHLLKSFEIAHPDLFELIEDCLEMGMMLSIRAAKESQFMGKSESFISLMWQALCGYHLESALSIMCESFDTGLSILRSASELSRDIACIGKDKAKVELWLNGRSRGPKSTRLNSEYRKAFQFDKESELGKATHKLYEICCDFGVHSHITGLVNSDFDRPVFANEEFRYVQVSHHGRLGCICLWLKGFLLTASLSARPLRLWRRPALNKTLNIFYEFTDSLGPAIKSAKESISNWEPDEAQSYWDGHIQFVSTDIKVRH